MATHTEPTRATESIGRRSLLKLGGAAIVGASLGQTTTASVEAASEASAPSATVAPTVAAQTSARAPGEELYRARWVPEGAVARVAYVTDHHYWPKHAENWGGGAQITSSSDRRMPDLVETLNALRPDVSIHGGDVISAAGAFFPPPDEYAAQIAFQAAFFKQLAQPAYAMVGNHETLDPHYASHDQLADWSRHFGAPHRVHDLPGWRLLTLNSMLPNKEARYGKGDAYGNVYGLDEPQLDWLRGQLAEAAGAKRHVILFTHVPPGDWGNLPAFEALLASQQTPVVKAIVCGHWHRNNLSFLSGIPVLVRTSNVETPFGYHLLHLYADGRIIIVQHSQHFPHDEFLSAGFAQGKQGARTDRYVTLGASSRMPLERLTVSGDDARATVVDGHLMLTSRQGRAALLIDTADLRDARLSLTLVKAGADAAGGLALADVQGRGGIEAVLTSRYSANGKVYLRRDRAVSAGGGSAGGGAAGPELLKPAWFNIGDDLSYRLTLEVRGGRLTAAWKNMLTLDTPVESTGGGRFGCFVDRGTIYVTDLVLERLT